MNFAAVFRTLADAPAGPAAPGFAAEPARAEGVPLGVAAAPEQGAPIEQGSTAAPDALADPGAAAAPAALVLPPAELQHGFAALVGRAVSGRCKGLPADAARRSAGHTALMRGALERTRASSAASQKLQGADDQG